MTGSSLETKTGVSRATVSRRRFIKVAGAAGVVLVACGVVGYYALTKQGPSATQKATTTVTQSSRETSLRTGPPFLGVSAPQRLLIIAPDEFMPALQPLVQHKNQTGMPTVAVSISSLKGWPNVQGVDDPETIKKAILWAHENLSTSYVMLVGDAHRFPVRFYFIHNLVSGDWSKWTKPETLIKPYGDWFPSDLYYANLYHHTGKYPRLSPGSFDNWDANGNGLYNEMTWLDTTDPNPDNVDGYPDVAVGRVPAHSAADVTAYVKKIISYETTSTRYEAHQRQFTFVGDQQYGDLDWSTGMVKDSGLMESNLVSARFLLIENDGSCGTGTATTRLPQNSAWANAAPADVANTVNVSNWVSYVGHGGPQVWGECGVFRASNVSETATSTALPIVYAAGCLTGRFISDLPWNAQYVDSSGIRHGPFSVNGPLFLDRSTGEQWGVNCPPGDTCKTPPATLPTPNAYDYDRPDQGFARSWLIANAPGGAIAYFGETGIAEDQMGVELEKYMFASYVRESKSVLGDIYLKAQQQYWGNHQNDHGRGPDFHSISRLYLGWMVCFGDPSLRLPPIMKG